MGADEVKQYLDALSKRQEKLDPDTDIQWLIDIKNDINRGNFSTALDQIELSIRAIPEQQSGLKSPDNGTREATEESLKGMYGDDYLSKSNQELEDLRRMREFLKNKVRDTGDALHKSEKQTRETQKAPENLKEKFGFVIHRMTVDGLLGGYTKFPFDKLSGEDQKRALEDLKKVLREYDDDKRVRGDKLKEFQNKIEAVRSDYFSK